VFSERNRQEFANWAGRYAFVLEIDSFANLALRGANLSYFDVFSAEKLRKQAAVEGVNPWAAFRATVSR